MKQVQEIALKKAISILDALGCQYHIDCEGYEVGSPINSTPKRGKKYGYGNITNYVRPFIEPMEVGKCVEIPIANFDKDSIQSIASSVAIKLFGKSSYVTSRNIENNSIEVMRIC